MTKQTRPVCTLPDCPGCKLFDALTDAIDQAIAGGIKPHGAMETLVQVFKFSGEKHLGMEIAGIQLIGRTNASKGAEAPGDVKTVIDSSSMLH